jgi:hypothetical protein
MKQLILSLNDKTISDIIVVILFFIVAFWFIYVVMKENIGKGDSGH